VEQKENRLKVERGHHFGGPVTNYPQRSDKKRSAVFESASQTPGNASAKSAFGPHSQANAGWNKDAWHCASCGKVLGVRLEKQMHVRFSRGHEYLVGFPVAATCRGCGTLNYTIQ
jgi:hypothetical protein